MSHPILIQSLIEQLPQPTVCYETHISWVIISGEWAYKIKKPVNYGFIDYTTLDKRKHYCELEVKLNCRLAKSLYIGTVPITGSEAEPRFSVQGDTIEYAVKMRAFNQSQLFSSLIQSNQLTNQHFLSISQQCAEFHRQAEISEDTYYGTPEAVIAPMRENFKALNELKAGHRYQVELNDMALWVEEKYHAHLPKLKERKAAGFIRATHGDLHLGNMVLINEKPVIFDCIEFNESFRWTDTMGDVGFLTMDLADKKRSDLASQFANRYFDITYDYDGAQLLSFYAAYRAMVRAKVAAIQLEHIELNHSLYQTLTSSLEKCIQSALNETRITAPRLILTHGVAGSGKTTYTNRLLTDTRVIRFSSDIIRKHLYQLEPFKACPEDQKAHLYSEGAHLRTYQMLFKLTEQFLKANFTVIVDATFIRSAQRAQFIALARSLNIETTIYSFEPSAQQLEAQLESRQDQHGASDGDVAIARAQLKIREPVSETEGAKIERILE